MRFKSSLRAYDSTVERNYATFGSINAAAGTLQINRANRLRNETGVYWQNELTHKFTTGGLQHQALYGLELSHQSKSDRGGYGAQCCDLQYFCPATGQLSKHSR